MLIARGKKTENIVEYLLYMWQIEDLIRALNLNLDEIQRVIIDQYDQPEPVKQEIRDWYESLIDMMKTEQVEKGGHLQLNQNVIMELEELHRQLLAAPKEQFYGMNFHKILPFIVELRAKSDNKSKGEIETCVNFMYGVLLLRLQKKSVSDETQAASQQIGGFLRMLATKYKQDKETGIDFD